MAVYAGCSIALQYPRFGSAGVDGVQKLVISDTDRRLTDLPSPAVFDLALFSRMPAIGYVRHPRLGCGAARSSADRQGLCFH